MTLIDVTTNNSLIIRKHDANIVYQDITIYDNKQKDHLFDIITFTNYYVYSLSIQQMINNNFINILDDKILMPNPHEEKGSQDFYIIKSNEFNSLFINKGQCILRFIFIQPSILWKTYEIKNIKMFTQSTSHSASSYNNIFKVYTPLSQLIEKDIYSIKANIISNSRIGGLEVVSGETIKRNTITKKKKKKINNNISKVSSLDVDITPVDDAIYIP